MKAKQLLTYLYFAECGQSNDEVLLKLICKIYPESTNEEIERVLTQHPEWERDTICFVDPDYPDWLKKSTNGACRRHLVFWRKDLERIKEEEGL